MICISCQTNYYISALVTIIVTNNLWKEKMAPNPDKYFSKTIEKGLFILTLFDRDHPRRSLSEISQISGINKTSTYRFVNTLVTLGYLKKNPANKLLKLGPRALLLGHNSLYGFDLMQITKPLIDKAFRKYKVTIDSSLFYEDSLLALYRREAPNTIFFRQPLISNDLYARSMGKAVLSKMNKTELDHFFKTVSLEKHTSKTLIQKDKIMAEIQATRQRGYSINNEEYILGIVSIGAPLLNFQSEKVVGAISFDFPASEQPIDAIINGYTGALTRLANDISEMVTMTES